MRDESDHRFPTPIGVFAVICFILHPSSFILRLCIELAHGRFDALVDPGHDRTGGATQGGVDAAPLVGRELPQDVVLLGHARGRGVDSRSRFWIPPSWCQVNRRGAPGSGGWTSRCEW